jgi:hypothetical protein
MAAVKAGSKKHQGGKNHQESQADGSVFHKNNSPTTGCMNLTDAQGR